MQSNTGDKRTLDKFTLGYLTCALWTSGDDAKGIESFLDSGDYSIDDIAPESIQAARELCAAFQVTHADDLDLYPTHKRCQDGEYTGAELAGHDLWLTRNGHGTGFWDREYGTDESRERLTDAAHKLGEAYLYLGDDGRLYLA